MKAITEIEDLAGKTIEKAAMLDGHETFGLLFTDKTYCSINVRFYGGDTHKLELEVQDDLESNDLRDLGVINEDEYQKLKTEEDAEWKVRCEANERSQYERLKAKFG